VIQDTHPAEKWFWNAVHINLVHRCASLRLSRSKNSAGIRVGNQCKGRVCIPTSQLGRNSSPSTNGLPISARGERAGSQTWAPRSNTARSYNTFWLNLGGGVSAQAELRENRPRPGAKADHHFPQKNGGARGCDTRETQLLVRRVDRSHRDSSFGKCWFSSCPHKSSI